MTQSSNGTLASAILGVRLAAGAWLCVEEDAWIVLVSQSVLRNDNSKVSAEVKLQSTSIVEFADTDWWRGGRVKLQWKRMGER